VNGSPLFEKEWDDLQEKALNLLPIAPDQELLLVM
jgi:hypothetical protein